MHNYAGDSSTFPTTIPLIDDSDPPDAAHFDPAPEALADRTAWLKLHALDKTGDTITGHVHVAAGAEIEVDPTGSIVVDHDASLIVNASAGLGSNPGTIFVNGRVSVSSGGELIIDIGGTGTVSGTLSAANSGSIKSSVDGGIQFGASATDFGSLSPARTKSYTAIIRPSDPTALDTTHWSSPGYEATAPPIIVGQASPTTPIYLELPNPHQGATLANVTVSLLVVSVHSGVPANLPALSVQRVHLVPGSALPASQTLNSGDSGSGIQFSPRPSTGAAWHASGNLQQLVYNCNQNATIDNVNYAYFLVLTDENGANAVAGNAYVAVTAEYTNISDLRFPC